MVCGRCGAAVTEGPKGGYVCGQCYYVVEPSGFAPDEQSGHAGWPDRRCLFKRHRGSISR
jgi:NMD protein affecting ribosome stability and mRNA decay